MSDQYSALLKEMRQREQKGPSSFVEAIYPSLMFKMKASSSVQAVVSAPEAAPTFAQEQEIVPAVELHSFAIPTDLQLFRQHKLTLGYPKIVFISDRLIATETRLNDSIPLDLSYSFLKEEAELFHRMCSAMKLSPEQYQVTAVRFNQQSDKPDYFDQARNEIEVWKPEMIITLGAVALNTFLPDGGKLSKVHGQVLNFAGTKLIPLFHPQFLLINPAMKKTTWMDMQKVMELLNLK